MDKEFNSKGLEYMALFNRFGVPLINPPENDN
jgi:hypothetical protein